MGNVLWVSLVEQELLSLPEYLILSPVRGAQSIVFCVLFCRLMFVLFLWHCIVCSSAVYAFSLFLWYLQALRIEYSYGFQLNIHIAIENNFTKYFCLSKRRSSVVKSARTYTVIVCANTNNACIDSQHVI